MWNGCFIGLHGVINMEALCRYFYVFCIEFLCLFFTSYFFKVVVDVMAS